MTNRDQAEGKAGGGTAGRSTANRGRFPGDRVRYERMCLELKGACDAIEHANFLDFDLEPFLRLAHGARRG